MNHERGHVSRIGIAPANDATRSLRGSGRRNRLTVSTRLVLGVRNQRHLPLIHVAARDLASRPTPHAQVKEEFPMRVDFHACRLIPKSHVPPHTPRPLAPI